MALACNHALELTGLAGDRTSAVHRLDPRAKVLALIAVTLLAVSTPVAAWPVHVACAFALAAYATVGRIGPATLWRRGRLILPLVILVAGTLPFVRTGGARVDLGFVRVSEAGLAVLASVAVKATLGTVGAILLGATTMYPAVLRALEALRVPRLLTLIAAFTYRYLFVVVGEAGRMRAALAARGYRPRTAFGAAATGRLATALFLRSYDRGERVHLAMTARGFAGRLPQLEVLAFARSDALFLGALVAGALALRAAAALWT